MTVAASDVHALSDVQWRPLPKAYIAAVYVVWFVASVAISVLGTQLPTRERELVQTLCTVGLFLLVHGAGIWLAYLRAAPYRAALASVRAENPRDLVSGVRLDPLTTPVGKDWSDYGKLGWGVIIVSDRGARIVRSDGTVLLDRPWHDFEFSLSGIDVTTGSEPEEWWFGFLGDTGIWPRQLTTARRRQLRRMQAMRPDLTPEEAASLR